MEEIDIPDQKLNKNEKGSKCIGSMQFHGNSCRQSINLWSRDRKKAKRHSYHFTVVVKKGSVNQTASDYLRRHTYQANLISEGVF